MKEGDVRIIRLDKLNLVVQRCDLVEKKEKVDGKMVKATPKLEWIDCGYYGRLDQAARCAVTESCGEIPVTPALVETAVQQIIEGTKSALGVTDPTRTRQP